jgi:hypothetical protein
MWQGTKDDACRIVEIGTYAVTIVPASTAVRNMPCTENGYQRFCGEFGWCGVYSWWVLPREERLRRLMTKGGLRLVFERRLFDRQFQMQN